MSHFLIFASIYVSCIMQLFLIDIFLCFFDNSSITTCPPFFSVVFAFFSIMLIFLCPLSFLVKVNPIQEAIIPTNGNNNNISFFVRRYQKECSPLFVISFSLRKCIKSFFIKNLESAV